LLRNSLRLALLISVALCIFCIGVKADEQSELYNEQFVQFSADKIIDGLAPPIQQMIGDEDVISAEKASQITSPKLLVQSAVNSAQAPLRLALKLTSQILALILAVGMFSSFELSDKAVQTVLGAVSSLAVAAVCFQPILDATRQMCDAVNMNTSLTLATLPVSAAITAASGAVADAAAIQGRTAIITALMSLVTSGAVLPLAESGLALVTAVSVSAGASISGIMSTIKKASSTLLSIAVTVVSSSLTLQSVMAKAADSAATKAVSYTVSGFVPVVGGPLSEVVKTVMSCSELVATTVGTVSMVSVLIMSAQPFFTVAFMQCALRLCAAVAQMTGVDGVSAFLSELASLVSIMLAVFLSSIVLLMLALGLAIV